MSKEKLITRLSDLQPDRRNANKGTKRGQGALTASLKNYALEIEPKYVAVALERMADMGLTPKLAA